MAFVSCMFLVPRSQVLLRNIRFNDTHLVFPYGDDPTPIG